MLDRCTASRVLSVAYATEKAEKIPAARIQEMTAFWSRHCNWRDGDKTQWQVLKGNHDAVVRRSYASGSQLRTDNDTSFGSGSRRADAEYRTHSPTTTWAELISYSSQWNLGTRVSLE